MRFKRVNKAAVGVSFVGTLILAGMAYEGFRMISNTINNLYEKTEKGGIEKWEDEGYQPTKTYLEVTSSNFVHINDLLEYWRLTGKTDSCGNKTETGSCEKKLHTFGKFNNGVCLEVWIDSSQLNNANLNFPLRTQKTKKEDCNSLGLLKR